MTDTPDSRDGHGSIDGASAPDDGSTGGAAGGPDSGPVRGPGDGGSPTRLRPRPLERPDTDPTEQAAFGRPDGVDSSFAPPSTHTPGDRARSGVGAAPPPTAAVARAFGRPDDGGAGLQRPPGPDGTATPGEQSREPFWPGGSAADPWRDPGTPVVAAPPHGDGEPEPAPQVADGPRLSVREVLFGKRVQPRALAILGVLALGAGALGGLVGHWTAAGASALTSPGAVLATAEEAKERPPGSVPEVAGRVLPSVVSLEVTVGNQAGNGSGVVIDPEGYVLTNDHVVAPATGPGQGTVEAVFSDGSRVPATVVGADPMTDLAVVKVPVANPTVAAIGRSGALAVGDSVIAIGSPFGLVGTVTTGIVSAVDRPVRLDPEGSAGDAVIDAVQTDAAINPGNSGGPLVDATGAVVGINTAIRSAGSAEAGGQGGSIGLGFAIPIDDARAIAEELIRTGRVVHADLGVNARSVTDGATDGAEVQNVVAGGPAAAAGIAEGDVVVRVAGRPIASADELVVAVREHEPGAPIPVELVRQGRPLTVTATLGER
ncbi:serine protease, S1-C subfamily, contains C-terminal PDZ domain [Pseudonocardia ammonioxydans]|uniref:Serine protease, S1-C subfamily, contains C-terminal PDZ domain n=1 Tax=Pseudonocardia ammonioxydans TaxID=260086 RepID=A0A1I4V2W1_PSUAM|nr:trypsin-like peptidase domain-containing protein [Pseudonocardia ammonioxydans]SFM95310.1 serine protease, S1-C subfamily, contains C-terminal PDZ domain [Pseudonocardia ammonioxydans]